MKLTKILFALFLLSVTTKLSGQSCKTLGTTVDEYNYVTKGYKVQIESGLDAKKGYEVKALNTFSGDGRKVEFKELIKDGKDLRAIMVIFKGKDGVVSYFCIPLGSSDAQLLKNYSNSVYVSIDNTAAMNFYQSALSQVLSGYLSK